MAEKSLKTGFLKWKPDYDSAASEYSKAATNFKNAKAYPQCKDCFLKAAECFKMNNSFFSAAKSIEQAALVSKDMGDFLEAANLVERACRLFQEHGVPDTAALCLDKGAKIIEAKHPERAISLYLRASDVVLLEDRPRQAAEYLGKASRLQIKLYRLDDAVETIKSEMDMHATAENRAAFGRLVVALIIVHLSRGDYVAADKVFRDGCSSLEQEETQTMTQLLEAYDQEDPDSLYRAVNSPFVKHMDVVFAKLARDLHIPGCIMQMDEARPRTLVADASSAPSQLTTFAPPPVEKLSDAIGSMSVGDSSAPGNTPAATGGRDEDDDDEGLL